MIELIIFIVIAIVLLILGIILPVRNIKEDREEETQEEVLNNKTVAIIESGQLSKERIEEIKQQTEVTQEMIKRNEYNSIIEPLKEYIVYIEEQHNVGQISDEDYRNELKCINDTISKFKEKYNIEEEVR